MLIARPDRGLGAAENAAICGTGRGRYRGKVLPASGVPGRKEDASGAGRMPQGAPAAERRGGYPVRGPFCRRQRSIGLFSGRSGLFCSGVCPPGGGKAVRNVFRATFPQRVILRRSSVRRRRGVRLLLPGCFCRTCFDGGSLKMRSGITRLPDRPASERSGGLNGCGAAYSCVGVLAGYCCRDGPFHAKESRRCIAETPKPLCRWRGGRDALSDGLPQGFAGRRKRARAAFPARALRIAAGALRED